MEKPLDELPIDEKCGDPADLTAWNELRRMLDVELRHLPEKYRTAFILCHLEGKTCEEAAEHLGCPRGTVQSRVGRARERLRARLTLRGWTPSSTSLIHLLEQHGSSLSAVSPVLVNATVQTAVLTALGKAMGATVSDSVFELMAETADEMRWGRLRYLAILVLLLLLGSSALAWGIATMGPETTTEAASTSTSSPCHSAPAQPK